MTNLSKTFVLFRNLWQTEPRRPTLSRKTKSFRFDVKINTSTYLPTRTCSSCGFSNLWFRTFHNDTLQKQQSLFANNCRGSLYKLVFLLTFFRGDRRPTRLFRAKFFTWLIAWPDLVILTNTLFTSILVLKHKNILIKA